jgi:hemerythrin HHE cation binding domain-containing protein
MNARHTVVIAGLTLLMAAPRAADAAPADSLPPYVAPTTLAAEHYEIYDVLQLASHESSEVGAASRALVEILGVHFVREAEYAQPPLALLPALAHGAPYPEMREILTITDRFAEELPVLLAEHEAIRLAADGLQVAARAEGRVELEQLADRVQRHLENEEQVTYPAALLVGRIVELTLGRDAWNR